MKFSEVIGQKEVWARLMQMAEEERIPHAVPVTADMEDYYLYLYGGSAYALHTDAAL